MPKESERSTPLPDNAADTIHFPAHQLEETLSGLGSQKRSSVSYPSKRLYARAGKSGMTFRIAAPIVIAMLIGTLVAAYIVQGRVFTIQLDYLKSDAANAAYACGVLGRRYLAPREKFLREHPEYAGSAEWLVGNHWLVKEGLVDPDEWTETTGFQLDELIPVPLLEQVAEKLMLADLNAWLTTPPGMTEIVAVYLLTSEGVLLATSTSGTFQTDYAGLKEIPTQDEYRAAAGIRTFVDYFEDFEPEPLARGLAKIMSPSESNRQLGSAIVVLRTLRHNQIQRDFQIFTFTMVISIAVFMSLIGWLATRPIARRVHRLATDMQAMAEGDYTRRSDCVESSEIGLLAQAFNSMAERLRVARANELETSRLESDLAIAKNIQNNLLPLQTPHIRGLDIHTSYRSAKEIGGDYFDFLPVDSHHMGIVVADASGKSIPAALVMSTTRAILRFIAPGSMSAAETLTKVNAILSVDIPKGMFVTACYIILDPLAGTMLCASAGHTPLLIAKNNGSVEQINPGGIALGFDGGPIFQRSIQEQNVKLAQGDRILIYTDGVIECVNTANEEYSERRLKEFLRRNRTLSSHDFIGALLTDMDRHRGAAEIRDDTTIVTFKVL